MHTRQYSFHLPYFNKHNFTSDGGYYADFGNYTLLSMFPRLICADFNAQNEVIH